MARGRKRRALDSCSHWPMPLEGAERLKASVRAKVERRFHVVKNLSRHRKVRCKGVTRRQAQLLALFGLARL